VPIETIKCQECGSADVTEFKAGSYVCGHCDAVFKHVDPSRVTIQREFCECGGAIAFQCRMCHTGICQGHDAWHHWREQRFHHFECIPTVVPAYRLPDETTNAWSNTWRGDYYMVTNARRSRALILSQFDGGEVHLCSPCFLDTFLRVLRPAYDDLAHKKVAGEACAEPLCEEKANVRCRCCGLTRCDEHSVEVRCGWRPGLCVACQNERFRIGEQVNVEMGFTRQLDYELNHVRSEISKRRKRTLERLHDEVEAEAERRFTSKPCEYLTDKGVLIDVTSGTTIHFCAAWGAA
jgi:hypothetical protein